MENEICVPQEKLSKIKPMRLWLDHKRGERVELCNFRFPLEQKEN